MKIAMIILGIIGAIAGFGGSIMTVIGGFAGTAAGVIADQNNTAMAGAMVFWAGVYTIAISLMALISSVVGGASKTKITTLTFSIATVVFGALSIYLFNFISGGLILIAGILGMVGANGAEQADKKLFKSVLFYFVAVVLVVSTVIAFAIRNANGLNKDSNGATKAVPTIPDIAKDLSKGAALANEVCECHATSGGDVHKGAECLQKQLEFQEQLKTESPLEMSAFLAKLSSCEALKNRPTSSVPSDMQTPQAAPDQAPSTEPAK